jgi:indolepyruvate ferredoxin oxidoreductase alpha subunit
MHSSQNEQDNRNLGRAAKVPVLEPIDSQSALELCREAFVISELFDTPVLLRTTTRICHGKSVVTPAARQTIELKPYSKQMDKYMMLPSVSRQRRWVLEERIENLRHYAVKSSFNRMDIRDPAVGIITSGVAAQYAREVFPQASMLVLMISHPFPHQLVHRFAQQVRELLVVEELDPLIESEVRAMGLSCRGKDVLPAVGELSPALLEQCLAPARAPAPVDTGDLPPRPPTMCAGCGHRPIFHLLSKLRCTVLGDIGCYTLGAYQPLAAMDTTLCMGASIGMAQGMEKAGRLGGGAKGGVVAVIGDSTFIHSGITSLLDVVYNKGTTTTIILDNGTTAMTGHQDHPGSGKTASGETAPALDYQKLARALGIRRTRVIDPYDLREAEAVLQAEIAAQEPSLIVARAPCALYALRGSSSPVALIDPKACSGCGQCLKIGCPALIDLGDKRAAVDQAVCVGCNVCVQVCKVDGAMRLADRGP